MKKTSLTLITLAFFAISCNQPTRNQAEKNDAKSPTEAVNEIKLSWEDEQYMAAWEEIMETATFIIYSGLTLAEAYLQFLNDRPELRKHLPTEYPNDDIMYTSNVDNEEVKVIIGARDYADAFSIELFYGYGRGSIALFFSYGILECGVGTKVRITYAGNKCERFSNNELFCGMDYFFSQFPLIGNTIGFVVFDSKAIFENRVDTLNKIEMLNDDGTIWHSLYSDFPDFTEEMHNELFRPLYFDPHAIRLAMRSIAKSENYYTIVVNEEKNLIKRVRKHSNLLFYTVEESVESSWLCTDVRINPLRKYPNDDAEVIEIDYRTDLFDPIERKGEWVKVRDVLAYEAETVGWIRWRKGDRFMVWVWCSI